MTDTPSASENQDIVIIDNEILNMPCGSQNECDVSNIESVGENVIDDAPTTTSKDEHEADILDAHAGEEDLTDDDEVLIMNFSDLEEDFSLTQRELIDPRQTSNLFEHDVGIKVESYPTYLIETKESILNEFDALTNEDEYILGADATDDIFAMTRNTSNEDDELTQAREEADSDCIVLESDSNDENIPIDNNLDIIESYDSLHGGNSSGNISSIKITNVTSVVETSEDNISLNQIEECVTNNNLESPISNMVLQNSPSVPKQVFKCEVCSFSSRTRFSLSRHKQVHTNLHVSDKKNEESTSENTIADQSEHVGLKMPRNNMFKCTVCSFVSKTRFALQRHLLTHTDNAKKHEKNIVTLQSNIVRNSQSKEKLKLTNQNGGESGNVRLVKCKYCSFVAKSKTGLVHHIRFVHKNKITVKCPSCSKIIKKRNMQDHQLTCIKVNRLGIKTTSKSIGIVKGTSKTNNVKSLGEKLKPDNNNEQKDRTKTKCFTDQNITKSSTKCKHCSYVAKNHVGFVTHVRMRHKKKIHPSQASNYMRCPYCHKVIKKNIIEHKRSCIKLNRLGVKSDPSTSKSVDAVKETGESNAVFPDKTDEVSNVDETSKTSRHKGLTSSTKTNDQLLKVNKKEDAESDDILTMKCKYCPHISQSIRNSRTHLRQHYKRKGIYSCTACGYISTKIALVRHIKTKHGGSRVARMVKFTKTIGKIKSEVNERSLLKDNVPARGRPSSGFKSVPETYSQPKLSDIKSSLYICEVCGYETNQKETLIVHKLTHDKATELLDAKDSENDVKQSISSLLPKSIKDEHALLKNGRRLCRECQCTFSKGKFLKHICLSDRIQMTETGKFECKICNYTSDQKSNLKRHLLVHQTFEESEKYKCSLCLFRTKRIDALKRHLKRRHGKKAGGKSFTYSCDNRNYRTNMKNKCVTGPISSGHTSSETKYKCENCDFRTDHKDNLQDHQIVHININEVRVYKNQTYNVKINAESSRKLGNQSNSSSTRRQINVNLETSSEVVPKSRNTDSNLFSCKFCTFSTKFRSSLLTHRNVCKVTVKEKKYKCDLCNFKSIRPQYINLHRKYTHGTSTLYSCDYCDYSSLVEVDLKQHKQEHLNVSSRGTPERSEKSTKTGIEFNCKLCMYKTNFRFKLKRHIEKAHIKKDNVKLSMENTLSDVTIFKCNFCPHTTNNKGNFKVHVLRHQSNKKSNIEKARKFTENKLSDVTTFKCNSCPYTTDHKGNFKVHVLLHQSKKKSNIEKARKFTENKLSDVTTFKCNSCPYTTDHKGNFKVHVLLHQSKNKSNIEKGRKFTENKLSDVTTFKCNSCPYTTDHKGNFKVHVLLHQSKNKSNIEKARKFTENKLSDVTTFKCNSCPYTTNNKGNFKVHVLRHQSKKKSNIEKARKFTENKLSDVTTFKCNSCPYTTDHKDNFKKHVHQSEKKPIFRCSSCSFRSYFKYSLLRHINRIHVKRQNSHQSDKLQGSKKPDVFKCSCCFYTASYKGNLKKHFETCHVGK